MSSAAVRSWLASTLAPIGIAIYPEPLAVLPSTDYIIFTRFPVRRTPLTFGAAGSLKENVYTPSLLIVLNNPNAVASPQDILDAYVNAAIELLEQTPTPQTITDPVTGEASEVVLITGMQVDPSPLNTLTATVLVPSLTEFSTEAA